jgi:hypothetical protein
VYGHGADGGFAILFVNGEVGSLAPVFRDQLRAVALQLGHELFQSKPGRRFSAFSPQGQVFLEDAMEVGTVPLVSRCG